MLPYEAFWMELIKVTSAGDEGLDLVVPKPCKSKVLAPLVDLSTADGLHLVEIEPSVRIGTRPQLITFVIMWGICTD